MDYCIYCPFSENKKKDTHFYKRKTSQTSILLTEVQYEYKKKCLLCMFNFFSLKTLLIESGSLKAKNVVQLL